MKNIFKTSDTSASQTSGILAGESEDARSDGKSQRAKKWAYLAAVLAPFALWLALIPWYWSMGSRITPDSAPYLETARSIYEGNGFQCRTLGNLAPENWMPLRVFPPGYPILIAGIMSLGVDDPYMAAKITSFACSAVFVLLVLGFYAGRLQPLSATLLGLGFVCMPSMLWSEAMCLSEAPFMLFSTIALLAFFRGIARDNGMAWRWILFAGIAGGFAYCIRNVGLVLFLTLLVFWGIQIAQRRFRQTIITASVWTAGWLIGSGWLLVRNIWLFHKLNPYGAPRSQQSLITGLDASVRVILSDMIGIPYSSFNDIVDKWSLLAIIVGLVIVSIFTAKPYLRRPWFRGISQHPAEVILGTFFVLQVLIVIAASSKYRIDPISSRFLSPGYWGLLWLLALWGTHLINRLSWERHIVRGIAGGALILFCFLQGRSNLDVWAANQNNLRERFLVNREAAIRIGSTISSSQTFLADPGAAVFLRIFGNANARRMTDKDPAMRNSITWRDIDNAFQNGLLRGIVIMRKNQNKIAEGKYGDALRDIFLHPDRYPQIAPPRTEGGMIVFEFLPSAASQLNASRTSQVNRTH